MRASGTTGIRIDNNDNKVLFIFGVVFYSLRTWQRYIALNNGLPGKRIYQGDRKPWSCRYGDRESDLFHSPIFSDHVFGDAGICAGPSRMTVTWMNALAIMHGIPEIKSLYVLFIKQ